MSGVSADEQKIARWLSEQPDDKQDQILSRVKMLAAVEQPVEDMLKAPISTLEDYLAIDIPTPPEIVKPGIIVRGELHTMTSRAGKGKTTFILNLLMRMAADLPMFEDIDVLVPGVEGGVKTLIIENEGSAGYFQDRMKDMIAAGEYTDEQAHKIKTNLLIWGDGSYSGVKVDDAGNLEKLRRGLKDWKPDVVFLDPFRSIWTGDENDGSQMNTAIDNLMRLCSDFDCAVFMNHHENKGKENVDAMDASRGSTVLEGAVATMLRWQHVKGGAASELSIGKMRYKPKAGPPAPVRMRFNFETWTYTHVGETELDRVVLRLLQDAPEAYLSVSEIAVELEETERKVRDRLNKLVEEQRVQKIRDGGGFRYRIKKASESGAPTEKKEALEF